MTRTGSCGVTPWDNRSPRQVLKFNNRDTPSSLLEFLAAIGRSELWALMFSILADRAAALEREDKATAPVNTCMSPSRWPFRLVALNSFRVQSLVPAVSNFTQR
jgi:hypothetical protein